MSPWARYALSGALLVTLVVGALWPFLTPPARSGVLLAALVALPVQLAAFAALLRFRGETNAFLAAWVGGTLARVAALSLAALAVIRSGLAGAIPMLLALAGFFFLLLLLEPLHFRAAPRGSN